MYVHFVGFSVSHAIQYDQSLMENQATEEEDMLENNVNTNSWNDEIACDTNIGTNGNREDMFEDDEEVSENSDVEDEFSGMEADQSEDKEGTEFGFWALNYYV